MLETPTFKHRSNALDVMRFACALWVLFAHLVPWALAVGQQGTVLALASNVMRGLQLLFQPVSETHPAVISFIVLSGYCVHRNGFRSEMSSIELRSYAIRRAFRIYPVFILATLAGVVVFSVGKANGGGVGNALFGAAPIEARFIAAKLIGLSAWIPPLNAATYQGNAPLHTVMVEIWLYAAYPFIVLALIRWGERRVWLALGAITLIGLSVCMKRPGWIDWWHNGSFFGFLFLWWVGARSVGWRWQSSNVVVCVGLWLLLTAVIIYGGVTHLFIIEARKLLLGVFVGGLIAWLDNARLGIWQSMAWLGNAGYSLYAFHTPAACALLLVGVPWYGVAASAVGVGIAVYLFYELPFMSAGRRLSQITLRVIPRLP